jgi:acyl-CoA synthetase (AMP-forming)/AMP-acid ligase II
VITGGENVYPVEVEDVLSRHPAVAEVSVVGVLDADWGERVEAAVVAADPTAVPSIESLAAFCRERLAGYKVPKRFHVVAALPLTSAMKVDKRALRELLTDA